MERRGGEMGQKQVIAVVGATGDSGRSKQRHDGAGIDQGCEFGQGQGARATGRRGGRGRRARWREFEAGVCGGCRGVLRDLFLVAFFSRKGIC
ncbi:hypothetical protein NSND_62813 [Nitrospira sp. ND1]|nr:hypothetical protein NSND_62813 [Nitrospira sp. ND1]